MEVDSATELPGSDLSFPATNVFGAHDFLNPLENVGMNSTVVTDLWQEAEPAELFASRQE
jgi:hypothetical protein